MIPLAESVQRAVNELIAEKGTKDVYHPEIGLIIKDGKATSLLIEFFKEMVLRKCSK